MKKWMNFLIVCLTAVGIIISLFLLVQVWRYRQPVTDRLQSSMDQFSSVLRITDDGLVVIDQVVKNVYTSTLYLDEASNAFSSTVNSTSQFMDSASTFVGNNLLSTITNTQTALGSAQASAKVIDNILSALSRVPLIGIPYNPATPLSTALGDVSSSLDPLQTTLKDFQTNLEDTRSNMQEFSSQIEVLNKNIVSMQTNLEQAQSTIDKYRSQIKSVTDWLAQAKISMPRWITTAAWLLSLMIVLIIFTQVALMLQAISQIGSGPTGEDYPQASP